MTSGLSLLHGSPCSKDNPEVIYWRSRLENAVSALDSELKLYDFRLPDCVDGKVKTISFHLLTPHRYWMNEGEIKDALQEKVAVYQSDIELEITFLKSFI